MKIRIKDELWGDLNKTHRLYDAIDFFIKIVLLANIGIVLWNDGTKYLGLVIFDAIVLSLLLILSQSKKKWENKLQNKENENVKTSRQTKQSEKDKYII